MIHHFLQRERERERSQYNGAGHECKGGTEKRQATPRWVVGWAGAGAGLQLSPENHSSQHKPFKCVHQELPHNCHRAGKASDVPSVTVKRLLSPGSVIHEGRLVVS